MQTVPCCVGKESTVTWAKYHSKSNVRTEPLKQNNTQRNGRITVEHLTKLVVGRGAMGWNEGDVRGEEGKAEEESK